MPDSLPPPGWGPAPFDERDLDAVLAGKTADVSVALRPVAEALAALRAGPAPAELHGEADAMAEFRALGLGRAGRRAATMPLEALPAGSRARPGRRPARHRVRPARRHPLRRAVLRPAVLSAVAAAAVIVVAVLVTGNFAGPLRAIAHRASPSAGTRSSAGTTGHSSAPRVETTSAGLETTPPPSATYSSPPPSPSGTCHAFYTDYLHSGLSPWATQQYLREQLIKLAHSDSWVKVYRYCAPYMKGLFPDASAGQNQPPPELAHPGPAYQNSVGQQNGGAAGSQTGSGSNQGNSGQGNTQGGQPTPGP
jgi:hypothetical protein